MSINLLKTTQRLDLFYKLHTTIVNKRIERPYPQTIYKYAVTHSERLKIFLKVFKRNLIFCVLLLRCHYNDKNLAFKHMCQQLILKRQLLLNRETYRFVFPWKIRLWKYCRSNVRSLGDSFKNVSVTYTAENNEATYIFQKFPLKR